MEILPHGATTGGSRVSITVVAGIHVVVVAIAVAIAKREWHSWAWTRDRCHRRVGYRSDEGVTDMGDSRG